MPEDEEDRPAVPRPPTLETMSVEALDAYRKALEREIDRVDAAIAAKRSARGDAEAIFRSKRES